MFNFEMQWLHHFSLFPSLKKHAADQWLPLVEFMDHRNRAWKPQMDPGWLNSAFIIMYSIC